MYLIRPKVLNIRPGCFGVETSEKCFLMRNGFLYTVIITVVVGSPVVTRADSELM